MSPHCLMPIWNAMQDSYNIMAISVVDISDTGVLQILIQWCVIGIGSISISNKKAATRGIFETHLHSESEKLGCEVDLFHVSFLGY